MYLQNLVESNKSNRKRSEVCSWFSFRYFLRPKDIFTFVGGAAKAVVKVGGKEASIALSKQGSKFVAKQQRVW